MPSHRFLFTLVTMHFQMFCRQNFPSKLTINKQVIEVPVEKIIIKEVPIEVIKEVVVEKIIEVLFQYLPLSSYIHK